MPNIDTIQDATPCCPGTRTNVNYGLARVKNTGDNQRLLCGMAMRWHHATATWTCSDGHRASGATVVSINGTIAADALAAA